MKDILNPLAISYPSLFPSSGQPVLLHYDILTQKGIRNSAAKQPWPETSEAVSNDESSHPWVYFLGISLQHSTVNTEDHHQERSSVLCFYTSKPETSADNETKLYHSETTSCLLRRPHSKPLTHSFCLPEHDSSLPVFALTLLLLFLPVCKRSCMCAHGMQEHICSCRL